MELLSFDAISLPRGLPSFDAKYPLVGRRRRDFVTLMLSLVFFNTFLKLWDLVSLGLEFGFWAEALEP